MDISRQICSVPQSQSQLASLSICPSLRRTGAPAFHNKAVFLPKVLYSFLLSSSSFQPLQRPSIRDSPHTAIKSSQRDAANGVIDQMIKDTETRARATKAKPLTIADIEAVMRLGVANSKMYMLCTPPPLLTSSATTVLSLFRR